MCVCLIPYRFQEESIFADGIFSDEKNHICNQYFNLPDRISSLTFPLARI